MANPDQTRLQQDALWCLRSPSLFDAPMMGFPSGDFFRKIDVDASSIVWPEPSDWHRFRLGRHFEQLWQAALNADPATEVLACNLAVRNQQRTLGEFDLVVRHCGEIEHWELAVKFYLASCPKPAFEDWFGPNPTDHLKGKFEHLTKRQLRLGQSPDGRKALALLGGESLCPTKAIVKGRLFYPFDEWKTADWASDAPLNPNHLAGWWIPKNDLIKAFGSSGHCCVILRKPFWLAERHTIPASLRLSASAATAALDPREQFAHHIAITDDSGREISRGFVVEQAWLEAVNALRPTRLN